MLIFFSSTTYAQVLVNKQWTTSLGNPSSGIEWSASVADASGNTYTTGHYVNSNLIIELYLAKKDNTGQTVWEEYFNLGTGTKSYGIALALDSTDIYIAGATYNGTNANHDYLVMKYDTAGVKDWHDTYNGASNGEDVPASITYDSTGNIYVTGGSYAGTDDYDYLTLKYSGSGTQLWSKQYDYNSLRDGAAIVTIDPSGDIVVTGGSESAIDTFDYATIKYSAATGSQLQERRVASGIIGLDVPLGFTGDDDGNFYLTGYGSPNGTDNDLYTMKMDEDLNIIWEEYFGSSGLEEAGRDVELDTAGNVYICGYADKSNGGSNYIIIKYDNDGNEIWTRQRAALDPTHPTKARFIEEDSYGNLVITGEETIGTNSRIKTVGFSPEGQLLWEDNHDGHPQAKEKALGIITREDGNILVTTHIKTTPTGSYQLVKYNLLKNDITYDLDQDSIPTNVHGEVIIRFNPQVVDTTFADNPDLLFGTVEEIITDQALIDTMDQILDGGVGRVEDWVMYKLHPFLSTSDRSATNRYGETFYFPSLWTSYILLLESNISEFEAADTLSTTHYSNIYYSVANRVYELSGSPSILPPPPDDTYYSTNQGALNATLDSDGNINIEPVWDPNDFNITGDPTIKVGIIDTGLSFNHEDFGYGDGVDHGGLAQTVVGAGYDFTAPSMMGYIEFDDEYFENDWGWGHGTRVAGIIGAIRNNDTGISGVAGGDLNGTGNRGVNLISLKAGTNGVTWGDGGSALRFAAVGTGEALVDILNNSWGQENFTGNANEIDYLNDKMEPIFKSGTIVLFSRGNHGNDGTHQPATLNDKWVISVGASGTNGERWTEDNNTQNTSNEELESSFGNGMDIIAPGTNDLVLTTNNLNPNPLDIHILNCTGEDFDDNEVYTCFNGTSSGTAFSSGVSALLLEHHRNEYGIDLMHEDIERLLSYGATDIDQFPNDPGYEEENGWGRLNAGGSFDLISNDQKIIHVEVFPSIESTISSAAWKLSRYYESPDPTFNGDGYFPGDVQMYGTIEKYSMQIDLDICAMGTGATIVDLDESLNKHAAWELNSVSNLWGQYEGDPTTTFPESAVVTPEDGIFWELGPTVLMNQCTLSGKLVGYVYQMEQIYPLPHPDDIFNYRMMFSVLVDDPNDQLTDGDIIITESKETTQLENFINVFPNPSSENIIVESTLNRSGQVLVELYDINGRLISNLDLGHQMIGTVQTYVSIEGLVNGLYFVKFVTEEFAATSSFIKQ